jgi:hypothetical protein
MKMLISFTAVCLALALCVSFASCSNTEKCLEKYGYKNCENLKNAFHLQNSDEAIKYHDIKTKCGCKD